MCFNGAMAIHGKSLLIFDYHVNTLQIFDVAYPNKINSADITFINEESLMGSTTNTGRAEGSYQPRGHVPAKGSFEEAFYDRVDSLVQRGKAVGITMTDICSKSGIARATPDRWREKAPLSITLVDKMEKAVVAAEKDARK